MRWTIIIFMNVRLSALGMAAKALWAKAVRRVCRIAHVHLAQRATEALQGFVFRFARV